MNKITREDFVLKTIAENKKAFIFYVTGDDADFMAHYGTVVDFQIRIETAIANKDEKSLAYYSGCLTIAKHSFKKLCNKLKSRLI